MDEIRQALLAAAGDGDIRKVESLQELSPTIFLHTKDDMLDRAVQSHQHAMALHLIVRHLAEVTLELEKDKYGFGGDPFATGLNEYHKTLEVFANAALDGGLPDDIRSNACYTLRKLAIASEDPAHLANFP